MIDDKSAQLNRQVQARADSDHRQELKGSGWLLLKKLENLNPDKNEHHRLQQVLELSQQPATAYYLIIVGKINF
ncbi:hypothetical protein D1AOALGA4SA_4708 [Olavius algarvensis Delta 1 endosymbiont]|nr:hypothetical protein D1AOALGA4SA_4708 [Olavius algarvensis Delta 1 endosymbiont]